MKTLECDIIITTSSNDITSHAEINRTTSVHCTVTNTKMFLKYSTIQFMSLVCGPLPK